MNGQRDGPETSVSIERQHFCIHPTHTLRCLQSSHYMMSGYHSSQYQQDPYHAQAAYHQRGPQPHPADTSSGYMAQQPYTQSQYPSPPQVYPGSSLPHPPSSLQQKPVVFLFIGDEDILNCRVDDPSGRTPFTIATQKKVTYFKTSDGNMIAVIEWDHSSPVMMYKGRKIKCKEWLRVIHDEKTGIKYVFV